MGKDGAGAAGLDMAEAAGGELLGRVQHDEVVGGEASADVVILQKVAPKATRVEPGLYDKKIYAPGVGVVLERALTGPTEVAKLVKMTG